MWELGEDDEYPQRKNHMVLPPKTSYCVRCHSDWVGT